jgi:hypothetical protein
MLVAGTAASVGLALLNERSRQGAALRPALAEAAVATGVAVQPRAGALAVPHAAPSREVATHRIGHASLIALVMLFAIAVAVSFIPLTRTVAGGLRGGSTPVAQAYGPSAELRAGASAATGWEGAYAAAVPSASDRGAALVAAVTRQREIDTLIALYNWAERERAAQAGTEARALDVPAPGVPGTLGRASGYAVGTVIPARITIYGCQGRGGGFCGGMSAGVAVFEGAAACSADLPFGTRFTIDGDPTGRVYECLDRGLLTATWVDVFFYNTEDGFAWASQLGSTRANIRIVN